MTWANGLITQPKKPRKTLSLPPKQSPIVWTRADPVALAAFDPATKQCTMNCGPHRDDPRSAAERKFLCPECWPVGVGSNGTG